MSLHLLVALGLVGYGLLVGFALILAKSAGERDVVYQPRPREIAQNVIVRRRAHDWQREEAT